LDEETKSRRNKSSSKDEYGFSPQYYTIKAERRALAASHEWGLGAKHQIRVLIYRETR
jgi:hypothetical protein